MSWYGTDGLLFEDKTIYMYFDTELVLLPYHIYVTDGMYRVSGLLYNLHELLLNYLNLELVEFFDPQLFKKLFAEGLKVQKERMHALRSYAKEQRSARAHQQQVDVEALETFYKDQFTMLAESVAQEQRNVEIRDGAQAKVSIL